MAATSDEPPDVTSDQPADGDQAAEADIPCAACIHLKENQDQDQDQDQDQFLIDVRSDLCDALESRASYTADVRAEGHEALRRTLRIWLKERANVKLHHHWANVKPHHDPPFLVQQLQYAYSKDELSFNQLEPQDLATVRCLKDVSAGLGAGLKVLLVSWKLTEEVVLEPDYKDHCEVLKQPVPEGASKEWHTRLLGPISQIVEVEKLVDPDDGELDVQHLPSSLKDTQVLADMDIQNDSGNIFYYNNHMKWESNFTLEALSPNPHRYGGSAPQRAMATHHYLSCALLLVPQAELDCLLLAQIPPSSARDAIPRYLELCDSSIPETRSRAFKTLHHLVNAAKAEEKASSRERSLIDVSLGRRIMQAALDNLEYGLLDAIIMTEIVNEPLDAAESVLQAVREALAKSPQFKFAEISGSLYWSIFIESMDSPSELSEVQRSVNALWALAPTGDGLSIRPDVRSWIVETIGPLILQNCRKQMTLMRSPEGRAIVDLVVRYYPRASLKKVLIRILAPNAHFDSFLLGALAQIDRYTGEGVLGREEGRAIHQRLAMSMVEAQSLDPSSFMGAGKDRETTALVDAQNLASLLCNSAKYETWKSPFDETTPSSAILLGMMQHLKDMDLSDMREYWVPGFLFTLIDLLPDCETEVSQRFSGPEHRGCVQSIVGDIASRYIRLLRGKVPPVGAQDYWRQPVRCPTHCKLCNELNSFLESQQQARGFRYDVGAAPDHIASQIDGWAGCKSVTEPVPRQWDPVGASRCDRLIIVTKMAQNYDQLAAAFEARLTIAREFITKLKEEPFRSKLKALFGDRTDAVIYADLHNPFKMDDGSDWDLLSDPILPLDHPLFPQRAVRKVIRLPPSLVVGSNLKRKAEDQGGR